MNIVLWVLQVFVALAFIGAGFPKVLQPIEKLKPFMGYVEDFSPGIVRLIGVLEVLGGLGLILPAAFRILPWLTPVAAICLVLTMIGALIVHVRRHENNHLVGPLVLLLLALFIAYGRFVLAPIA